MLNTCPPEYSCGVASPIWTDEDAPEDVLSPATITAYVSAYEPGYTAPSDCMYNSLQVQVMRCSLDTEYDLVYRYIGRYFSLCYIGFCGMS